MITIKNAIQALFKICLISIILFVLGCDITNSPEEPNPLEYVAYWSHVNVSPQDDTGVTAYNPLKSVSTTYNRKVVLPYYYHSGQESIQADFIMRRAATYTGYVHARFAVYEHDADEGTGIGIMVVADSTSHDSYTKVEKIIDIELSPDIFEEEKLYLLAFEMKVDDVEYMRGSCLVSLLAIGLWER